MKIIMVRERVKYKENWKDGRRKKHTILSKEKRPFNVFYVTDEQFVDKSVVRWVHGRLFFSFLS
jgi:hypothetical protein